MVLSGMSNDLFGNSLSSMNWELIDSLKSFPLGPAHGVDVRGRLLGRIAEDRADETRIRLF